MLADSSYDSPYRTGRHVPLADGRGGMLTSVATATESRVDISSPYTDDTGRFSSQVSRADIAPYTPTSPVVGRPYSPGLRSQSAQRAAPGDGFETQAPNGEIPMQSFDGGVAPPPPVAHSWKRIDAWADENYPELFDQLCQGATNNDLNELEHQLDCSLPQEVRESLMIHDGQERGGTPTGIIFSGMLMDCEEIVQEWNNWRKVNQEFLSDAAAARPPLPTVPSNVHAGSNEASSSKVAPPPVTTSNGNWRRDLQQKQSCIPPNSIQKVYAHPAWIPLVRDWGGNNLAVDLAPGPAGKWGQIILFGRDYDTKYVVARSWAAFLALVSDDLRSGKWFVDEDTNDLKLREFKKARVEPAYFDILRWRMDQKYGRRVANRKSAAPNGMASPAGSASPYTSPVEPNGHGELRGRTAQRIPGTSPLVSPIRPGTGVVGRSSPLARVTEEATAAAETRTNAIPPNLLELETPRPSEDGAARSTAQLKSEASTASEGKGKEIAAPRPLSVKSIDAMKTIEI